ncbi:GRIP and coiled-coil domain-containing protein 2 isoform X1 [Ixodes scapularis]|uniref:GRIP and coiled-coil domain-containing protein 2 isoform X1 n=1 Tax=Ixodes scapularis TaxID=6945 RepID=UPI001C38A6B9|nr:GRIP and coiled-coil domain-containing protein 2 isoform X1 [Ixodes scapularis]
MDKLQDQSSEKNPKISVEEASREDLVKQVKRQLALLQKAKARCDDLNKRCHERDKVNEELLSRCEALEAEQKETEELRQAYLSLQGAQEKQFESFQVLEDQLAASNEDLVKWRRKYQECLEKLECTESKMAAYTQGTECLREEFKKLELDNKVCHARMEEVLQSQKQLEVEKTALQQRLATLEQEKLPAESEARIEISQGHMKQKIEELLSQCNMLKQDRDSANASREALMQQVQSANEEVCSLQEQLSALLEERSCLENQRDMKMNECNLLQEEKHGLEEQVSNLYQAKEELEAKEKEFVKILDDNSSLEKSLSEAVNENTQLQLCVNDLQERLRVVQAAKERLASDLEIALESTKELQTQRCLVQQLEEKLAENAEVHQSLMQQLEVSTAQKLESTKLIENLRNSLASAEQRLSRGGQDPLDFESQEAVDNRNADEEELKDLKREREQLLSKVSDLEKAVSRLRDEMSELQEQLDVARRGDKSLLQNLQSSAAKVSLLEKQLNDSMHQKQDIIDELNQVKDLQHFLEDEAKELHQECDKLKTQAGQLEADLENDRLHIQKLEHELEDAETRDQQSFKELETLRGHLNEMALCTLKAQDTLRRCTESDVELRVVQLQREFYRLCQLVLETAERNLVDIHVEGLPPGTGATLVLNDSCEFGAPSCEEGEQSKDDTVSDEAFEALKREVEGLQEQLTASRNSVDLLQFEKQAVEEELAMEKITKEKFNRDLAASNEQLALAKQRAEEVLAETTLQIAEFEKRLEDSSRNLSDRDEALQSVSKELDDMHLRYSELENKYSQLSEKISVDQASIAKNQASLIAEKDSMLKRLQSELEKANEQSAKLKADLEFSQVEIQELRLQCDTMGSQNVRATSELTSKYDNEIKHLEETVKSLKHGNDTLVEEISQKGKDLSLHADDLTDAKQQLLLLQQEVASLRAANLALTQECSMLSSSLEASKADVEKLSTCLSSSSVEKDTLQEGLSQELSSTRAELISKTKLLEEIHSRLDDQLERTENLQALLTTLEEEHKGCRTQIDNKESELSAAKDEVTQLQKECAKLCTIFKSDSLPNEDSVPCHEWYTAQMTALKLISRLVAYAIKPQDHNSADTATMLAEAGAVHAALSSKIESYDEIENGPLSLERVFSKAMFDNVVILLAVLSDIQQLWNSLAKDAEQISEDSSLTEPVEPEQESEKMAELLSSLKEKDDMLAKFKALAMRLKKELAEKGKQMNSLEKELSSVKQELEKNSQASKQTVQNFQAWEQCKADFEAKIITLEAQLCTAKGQEDRLQSHMKALEEQMDELKRQLGAEREQHANTAHQLDRMQKESKMHSLLDLEIADYERTVAELNNLLKEKNEELDNSRKEALTYQTKISDLVEHTGYLESQKKSDDERLLAFKDTVANLKEELAQSRRHEEELVRAEVRLESEIRAIQLREEETKLSFAELSRKCQSLEASLRSSRENHQRATKTLESKIASLKEVLATTQSELETTKAEFDNYKVRVHTVLKQQKKSTAPSGDASGGDSDAQEKMHSVIEQLRLRIKDLTEQLEVGQSEAEAAQEEYDRLAQRHQLVASELEAREREWKHRLEEALKQKTLEMGIELEKQLEQQYETLSSKFQKKISQKEQEHQSALESQQEAFEELKREMSELQQKLPTVQQDDVVPFDITTQERQDGEGSESISPVPAIPAKVS